MSYNKYIYLKGTVRRIFLIDFKQIHLQLFTLTHQMDPFALMDSIFLSKLPNISKPVSSYKMWVAIPQKAQIS